MDEHSPGRDATLSPRMLTEADRQHLRSEMHLHHAMSGAGGPPLTMDEIAVLRVLDGASVPKGARIVQRELADDGRPMSEASVSRALIRLDERQLTVAVGRKGRVLTPEGQALLSDLTRSVHRGAGLAGALDVQQIEQLIDLLRARRGLEREIVELAAQRITPADLDLLEEALDEHSSMLVWTDYEGAVANRFHKVLVRCARSPVFEALSSVVLYDALDALDPLLYIVTSMNGTVQAAPDEHKQIVEALRRRDGAEAQRILDEHLSRLVGEVEEFRDRNGNGTFVDLLSMTKSGA